MMMIPVWTSPGAHPALFTVGNGPLSWEHSIQGMELFTGSTTFRAWSCSLGAQHSGHGAVHWQHSIQGMELFTHPSVVLILRISRALPLLLLCPAIGMLWSALL